MADVTEETTDSLFEQEIEIEEEQRRPAEKAAPEPVVAETEPAADDIAPAPDEPLVDAAPEESPEVTETVAKTTEEPAPEAAKPVTPAAPVVPAVDPAEIESLRAARAEFEQAMQNPDVRKAYFRKLHSEGRLNPAYLHEFQEAAPVAPVPAAPVVPKITQEEAAKQFQAHMAAGNEAAAFKVQNDFFAQTFGGQVQELQGKLNAEEQRRNNEALRAEQMRMDSQIKGQIAELAKQWPTLIGVRADGHAQWKDEAVRKAFLENCEGVSPKKSLDKIMRFTLGELGRLESKPKVAAVTKQPAKPAPAGTAKTKSTAQADPPGVFTVQIGVEE